MKDGRSYVKLMLKITPDSKKCGMGSLFNPVQPSVAIHIEASHLFSSVKQMTGFYIKCNIGLEWVNSKIVQYHAIECKLQVEERPVATLHTASSY